MSLRLFSSKEIENIYNTKVKKEGSYFSKYESLEQYQDGYIDVLFKDHDFPRIPCVLDFKEWIIKYNIKPDKVLLTCQRDYELNYLTSNRTFVISYDEKDDKNDLHVLNLPYKEFDFCIFSQTLEHLYNPLLCIINLGAHIKTGGYIFTSVPMVNIPHNMPHYYYGINPLGLSLMFMSAGFEVLEIGQWGNINYIKSLFENHEWPDYQLLKELGNGTVKNEERNICQTWGLFRKL